MKALMTGVPFRCIDTASTGPVTGIPFAVPYRTSPTIMALVVPNGAVSAFEYTIFASTDGGVTWSAVKTAIITQGDFVDFQFVMQFPLVRIDQVSRTGGTSQAVDLTLGQY